MLRNGAATRYPAWYDEGLAEFLSTVAMQGDQVVIGTIPASRERWLLYGSPMSLRQLMTVDEAYDESVRTPQRFYAQAWTLTHFFHVADRVGFPKRRAQLTDYIARLNRGEPPDQACQNAFGTDFESLDKEFMQYLAKGRLPYLGVAPQRLAISRADPDPVAAGVRAPLPAGRPRARAGRDLARRGGAVVPPGGAGRSGERPRVRRARAHRAQIAQQADADFARALSLAGTTRRCSGTTPRRCSRAPRRIPPIDTRLIQLSRDAFRRSIQLDPDQVAAYAGLGQQLRRSHPRWAIRPRGSPRSEPRASVCRPTT